MYICEGMIEIGLKEGQHFPTTNHREVACSITLCNTNVRAADVLMTVVQAVLKVPVKRIRKVTYHQLIKEFDMPDVGIPK